MTKRDITRAAIAHKDIGRVPYCINLTRDAINAYQNELDEYFFNDDIRYAIKNGILTFMEGCQLGFGNYVFCSLEKPWWTWHDLPDQYKGYDAPTLPPKVRGIGSYKRYAEKLAYIKETTDCYITVMIYGSHFEKANNCRGIENFLADMSINKDFAKKLLSGIIDRNMIMIENLLYYDEVDGILLGSDWGSQQDLLMSPKVWNELIAPGEQREYDLIKSQNKDVWIHSCGNIEKIMPRLIEMGVDVLNPVQPECMDIEMIKKEFGALTFWGGISTQQTLPYGTPDEVRAEVDEVIGILGNGGGYITAPAQEIQDDVPFENIVALVEAAKNRA